MIEKLEIKNFQKHSKKTIEFGEGVTSIIGPSDTGKSAIIRALRLVVSNEPSGDAFIKEGTTKTEITLTTDDMKIERVKGKSDNYYTINKTKLEAFGQSVPEEISKALNITPLNFQTQYASPYWLNETGGEVSRQLNQIVNLEIIDKVLANLNSSIKTTNTFISVCQTRMTSLKTERDGIIFYKEIDKDLIPLETAQTQIANKQAQLQRLQTILGDIQQEDDKEKSLARLILIGEEPITAGSKLKALTKTVNSLKQLLEDIEEKTKQASIEIPSIPNITPLQTKITSLQTKTKALNNLINDIEMAIDKETRREENVKEAQIEYNETIKGKCPFLGIECNKI